MTHPNTDPHRVAVLKVLPSILREKGVSPSERTLRVWLSGRLPSAQIIRDAFAQALVESEQRIAKGQP